MNKFINFLKDNKDFFLVLTSFFSTLITLVIATFNIQKAKKDISISNKNILMSNFYNYLLINKDIYLTEKIFSDDKNKDFFLENLHLFDKHSKILLLSIWNLENTNNTTKEKYILTKEYFLNSHLDFIHNFYYDILSNEINSYSPLWIMPISIRIFIRMSIIMFVLLFIIALLSQSFIFLLRYIFFISLILVLSYFLINFLYGNKLFTSNIILYIIPKYLMIDENLYCIRCKKSFNSYMGLKISCPKKHKISIFLRISFCEFLKNKIVFLKEIIKR